jgi:hypothetical protein
VVNFWDWFSLGLSAILFLLWTLWLTWRLEPTWKAFEGMIEIIADATRF